MAEGERGRGREGERARRVERARELVLLVGIGAAVWGIGAYDWRAALIVGGMAAAAGALAGMGRGAN